MTRAVCGGLVSAALLLASGCDRSERAKANHAAEEARAKARQLGHEVKEQAHEVASQVKTNGTGNAGEKLERGEQDLKRAGAEASVKLDHAAVIARVKAQLASDLGASSVTNISVDASGAQVTLTGHVASTAQKKAAENAALRVPGVDHVRNDLRIEP